MLEMGTERIVRGESCVHGGRERVNLVHDVKLERS